MTINACCLCEVHVEDVSHIITNCSKIYFDIICQSVKTSLQNRKKKEKRKIQNARLNKRDMSLSINIMELNIDGTLLLKQL